MIVPMLKITLLMLDSEREKALQVLRDLAVLHVEEQEVPESAAMAELQSEAAHLERVISLLNSLLDKNIRKEKSHFTPEQILAKVDALLQEKEQCLRSAEECTRNIAELEPWGNFSLRSLQSLKQKGIFVSCCVLPKAAFQEFSCEEGAVSQIARRGDQVYFTVTALREIPDLPLAPLPKQDVSLSEEQSRFKEVSARLQEIGEELNVIAANDLDLLRKKQQETADAAAFCRTRDTMARYGRIYAVSGFIPAEQLPTIREAASQQGWAMLSCDADVNQEPVPTLVRMPKWVKIVTPLFDFLGIAPGYSELDASAVILLFFTIFFGILVGDAAYGAVFLIAALFGFFRASGKLRETAAFVVLLSGSAIVWGILTNNYFGCHVNALESLECRALSSAADKDANVQYLCFALGAIQMTIGHFWQTLRDLRFRNVGRQIGWLLMMTANFLLIRTMIVYPGTTHYPATLPYFYFAAFLILSFCEVNWRDPGSILGFPFSLINSFVDLLSYIRLFAVGMAGYYLAFSFNGIAKILMDGTAAGFAAGCAVLLIGHLLNIGLAVLSVLVHGVRLNTLEFSSHTGLQWGGFAYRPFAKHNND